MNIKKTYNQTNKQKLFNVFQMLTEKEDVQLLF